MDPAQRSSKPSEIIRRNLPSGRIGEGHGPEERDLSSVTTHRRKSRGSRKAASRGGGKQPVECHNTGELSRLPGMPLDILYEIFSRVRPMDLLRILWASKGFRNFLANKSSRRVWATSFGNIHEALRPPPCPEDLTEIGYANLLYNLCCMGCGRVRGQAYWAAYVRVCASCIKDWVTVQGGAQDNAIVDLSGGNLPSSSWVLPTVSIKRLPPQKRIHMFTKDLKKLAADLEASNDKAAVVQRYKDGLYAKTELARELEILDKVGAVGRGAVHIAAREKRIDQIVERLASGGWREKIASHKQEYLRCIIRMEGACVARPLPEKAWYEMSGGVHRGMHECKWGIYIRALETSRRTG